MVGVDLERAHRATRRRRSTSTTSTTAAAGHAFWTPPPGDPGTAAFVFNGTIYYRGGMTLQALRVKIGDFAFFSLLRTLGAAEPLRQRDDAAVHRARRADQRDGPRRVLRRLALPAGEADVLVARPRPRRAVRRRGGPRAGPPRRRARGRAGSARSARAPRARSAGTGRPRRARAPRGSSSSASSSRPCAARTTPSANVVVICESASCGPTVSRASSAKRLGLVDPARRRRAAPRARAGTRTGTRGRRAS